MVPESERAQRTPHRLRVTDLRTNLLHRECACRILGGNDSRVMGRSLPPYCRITSHVSPPALPYMRSGPVPPRAPVPPGERIPECPVHALSPVPCCAGWSSPGSL